MKRVPIYVYFSQGWNNLDYSDESLLECFEWDSSGGEIKNPLNGYAVGKKWMDVTVKMWREDIRKGLLYKYELYEDPELQPFIDWVKEQVGDALPMSMTEEEFDAYTDQQARTVYCDPDEDKQRKRQLEDKETPCICNNCGKDFLVHSTNADGEKFPMGYYGLVDATYNGGYDSKELSDCLEYTFSLCEACLKEMFKGFKIPPRIRNYTNVRW